MDRLLHHAAQRRGADVSYLGADVFAVGDYVNALLFDFRQRPRIAHRLDAGRAIYDLRRAGTRYARDSDDELREYVVHVFLVKILRALD